MTPPTIHEFAGIFMLALMIAHPSTGSHAATVPLVAISTDAVNTPLIDGIEPITLPAPRGTDSNNNASDVRGSALR